MRSFFIPCALLLLLFSLSLYNSFYMQDYAQDLTAELQQLQQQLQQEQWAAARDTLASYERRWQSHQLYLHVVAEHSEIDDAEDLLASLKAFVAYRELPESLSELAYLKKQIRLLGDLQELSWENIL